MITPTHVLDRRQHDLLCTPGKPGSAWIRWTSQKMLFAKPCLPTFQIDVAGKSGAVQAHDEGITIRGSIRQWNRQGDRVDLALNSTPSLAIVPMG